MDQLSGNAKSSVRLTSSPATGLCRIVVHGQVDNQLASPEGAMIYPKIFKTSFPIARMTEECECWLGGTGLFLDESFVESGSSVGDESVSNGDSVSNEEILSEIALVSQNDSCMIQTHVSKCPADLGQDLKFSLKKGKSKRIKKTEGQELSAEKAKYDRKYEKDALFEHMKLSQDPKRQSQQAETVEDEQTDIELSSEQRQIALMDKLWDIEIAIDCHTWGNQANLKLQYEQAKNALKSVQAGAEDEQTNLKPASDISEQLQVKLAKKLSSISKVLSNLTLEEGAELRLKFEQVKTEALESVQDEVEAEQSEAEFSSIELKHRSRARRQLADRSKGRTPKLRCLGCREVDEGLRTSGLKQNCRQPRDFHRQRELRVKEARRTKGVAHENAFEVSGN